MVVTQAADKSWDEPGAPFPLCVLALKPEDFSRRWNIQFTDFEDDGLGPCKSAIVLLGEVLCLLESHPLGLAEAQLVTVFIQSTEPDSNLALHKLLTELGLDRNDLAWDSECLGPAQWGLFRIDDNGNEFEMQRFLLEVSANWVMRSYEKRGHKQSYLVRHFA